MEIINGLMSYTGECFAAMSPCYKWYFVFIVSLLVGYYSRLKPVSIQLLSFVLFDFIWKILTPIGDWYYKQDRETQLGNLSSMKYLKG